MGEHGQPQASHPHPGAPYPAQPAQYVQQAPYQYVHVAAPPPPPPPRKRGRALWIVLTYFVVFAVLAAGAWFVPPLVWPGPALTAITHPGPTSVQGLVDLLAAPAQATLGGTEELDIQEIAAAVEPTDPRSQIMALRNRGFRWGASLTWTGDDGRSRGTLRLTQFGTVEGARMHHLKLLLMERMRTTAEETSIVEVPGAALFTDENLDDGEIVRAAFGRGVITGEIAVTEASGHVRDDVLAQVVSLADALPHDRWDWADPPVTPIDLAALLLPPPADAHNPSTEEFRLREAAKSYIDVDAGAEYLQALGFQRGVLTAWGQPNIVVNVMLTLYGDNYGPRYYTENNRDENLRLHPEAAPGDPVIGVIGGLAHYYTYRNNQVGFATFFRGHIAVQVYVVSSRAIDKANFVSLVQQQYDRLP